MQIHRDVFAQVPAKAISRVAVWPDLAVIRLRAPHAASPTAWPDLSAVGGRDPGAPYSSNF